MKKLLIILAIVVLALFFSNPGLNDFEQYARNKYGEKVKEKLFEEPLTGLGAGLAHLFGELKVCRQNNYIYSVYYLKVSLLGETQIKPLAIGVGSFFFPLEKEFIEEERQFSKCENAVNFVRF